MRKLSFLLWVLILVDGVFGADVDGEKPVSVMEGDSVTLYTKVTEVKSDDKIEWVFGVDNYIIAKIEGGKITKHDFSDGRFKDRLEMDSNGSLTIKNIQKEHEGLYELDISGIHQISKRFRVTVRDKDNVESVSVTEGDTVTLHTGVTKIQRDDQILWKFGDQGTLIARLNGAVDARWSNIDLNVQTGEITIRNIRRDQTGDYKVEINTSSMILHRKFRISDVFSNEKDGVKTVSETKGDSVRLHTHITVIQQNDPIEWTYGPQNIPVAKTDGKSNIISYNYNDERFNNRLYLDIRNGDLTIKKSSTEHSGLYQLKIITSTYTIQKSFSVTVSGAVSVISGASVGLMVWAVTVFLLQEV